MDKEYLYKDDLDWLDMYEVVPALKALFSIKTKQTVSLVVSSRDKDPLVISIIPNKDGSITLIRLSEAST